MGFKSFVNFFFLFNSNSTAFQFCKSRVCALADTQLRFISPCWEVVDNFVGILTAR